MKQLEIKGRAEMDAFLQTLAPKLGRSIVRGGMRELAKVVAEEAKVLVNSDAVRGSIGVSGRMMPDGTIISKVRTKGKGAFIAPWLEFGTAAHFISIDLDARPESKTRRGVRKWSIGLINKAAKRGSLIIGNQFVGASVHHPGAEAKAFLRPAADNALGRGMEAMGQYIRARLTKEGLDAPDLGGSDDE
ncbi:hypothetical protein [Sphingomonas sp. SRS2]|uniref:hypothetical protein n=1 Tax=Sphingomonas sp. SRS2 TaxID=133190 RepID=UPI000618462A|nr:hypothetical protein [Sphingomonas sp. SRS2]KKC27305.1 hypothetical protein WP12_03930 [Sphingomonas sp. SRS2]